MPAVIVAHVKQVVKTGVFDEVLDEIIAEQRGHRQKGRKDVDTERAELRSGQSPRVFPTQLRPNRQ
jgi:hypothetical protein